MRGEYLSVTVSIECRVRGHRECYASLAAHLMFASYNTLITYQYMNRTPRLRIRLSVS
jgi:hypothetical protein